MRYTLELSDKFEKQFQKLDKYTQRMIKHWLDKNLDNCLDPRTHGKALTENHKGKWRYRIGNYRVIAEIQEEVLVILALEIGHRRDIYLKK